MTKTTTEETPRSYDHLGKPILSMTADGTPMLAPKGAPSLMSTTYASSHADSSASTRELVGQSSKCTVEEKAGRRAPEVEIATEEGLNEEDSGDWIALNVWGTVAKLMSDKPLEFYRDFIVASVDQKWRLVSAGEWPTCSVHNHSGFFFDDPPLDVVGVRIPFSGFQKEALDWLHVTPSQLQPNAWGFLRGFKMVMEYLGRIPTSKVFFCFFNVLRSLEKGSEIIRKGAIKFRCNGLRSIFLVANDSNKDYKEYFFFV